MPRKRALSGATPLDVKHGGRGIRVSVSEEGRTEVSTFALPIRIWHFRLLRQLSNLTAATFPHSVTRCYLTPPPVSVQ